MGNKNQCCDKPQESNNYQELFDKRISDYTNASSEDLEYSLLNSQLSSSLLGQKVRLKPTKSPFPRVPMMFHIGKQEIGYQIDITDADRRFLVLRVPYDSDRILLQCNNLVANSGHGDAIVGSTAGDWLFEGLIDGWTAKAGFLATDQEFFYGQFVRNALDDCVPHGHIRWGDVAGNRYDGMMHNGKRHGKGLLTDISGWQYEGDFYENELTGQGRMIYANGDLYSGGFSGGLKHGNGHMAWKASGCSYKGFWQRDMREGYGTFATPEYSYTGEWSGNKKSGRGVVNYTNGEKHETVWVDDVCVS